MPSRSDQRAALVLAALGALGLIVRVLLSGGTAPGAVAYRFAAGTTIARDSVVAAAARLARPLAPGEAVDVDRAPASELVRLPRIGPGLAARIVANREAHGPFGSLDALGRVPGVGVATLEGLSSHVTFSGQARPTPAAGDARIDPNRASPAELEGLPGVGPALAAAIVEERRRGGPYRSAADLMRVRGIGPALVRRVTARIRIP
jgi:competence ComEA-like helix-hairpin-helix protein